MWILLTGLALFLTGNAWSDPGGLTSLLKKKEVEVRLKAVFIPEEGLDDHERVEIIVSGELPGPCTTLDRTYSEPTSDGKGFRVHQMAWQWNSGTCATGDLASQPVTFALPLSLGQLRAASYRIEYLAENGNWEKRQFSVARAPR